MEHEDNYMQNSQNLLENVPIASGGGCGDIGGLVDGEEIIGGKFEHDDDEEMKYIKEVQQSEKQQALKVEGKDAFAAATEVGNGYGYGAGSSFGGNDNDFVLGQHAQNEFGNGHVDVATINAAASAAATAVVMDDEEVGLIRNDGDFSTTSNTTSTPGEDVAADVLQVEMKIEPQQLQQQQHHDEALFESSGREDIEEEEPSSLATTNGTSSLSENPLQQMSPQQQQEHQQQEYTMPNQNDVIIGKDNEDPQPINNDTMHPLNLDIETHSQLNPDAKEFVPSFGSPTIAVATPDFCVENVGEPAATQRSGVEPHPSALPRHVWSSGDDDFIAQSPRKGGDIDMEEINLPAEDDFDHEADMRPHELQHEDDLIGDGTLQEKDFVVEDLDMANKDNIDFKSQSPASFIDHGPETCVDLDADINHQPLEDIKTRLTEDVEPNQIEDILNSVQPLPSDFESEEENVKELLNVEEKERISQSPSTEEMQMNLRNQSYESSIKDIPQIPIDMDNAAHMEESFYMENTSHDVMSGEPDTTLANDSLLVNTSSPLQSAALVDTSIQMMRETTPTPIADDQSVNVAEPPHNLQISVTPTLDHKLAGDTTPSPLSTEEKHLMEETKEQTVAGTIQLRELEQKMDDLLLSNDGNLPQQVEEIANIATTIPVNANPFFTHDAQFDHAPQSPSFESQQIEQFYANNEQRVNEQMLKVFEQPQMQQPDVVVLPGFESEFKPTPEPETISVGDVAPVAIAEPSSTPSVTEAVAAAAMVGTAAIVAAAAGVPTAKKADAAKKPASAAGKSAAASKPKMGDARKLTETKKPSTGSTARPTTTAAARPRTAPAKTTTGAAVPEKKTTTATAAARPATATATRKPLTSTPPGRTATTASTRSAPTAAVTSKTSLTSKPLASRTSTTSTATRKSAPSGTSTVATNGKPGTAVAAAKPTSLAVSATAKPKLSPRSTLASQLRKAAPSAPTKSPTKSQSTTNTLAARTSALSAPSNRLKNVASATATTTKTFTARPAPKTTSSTVISATTTRRNVGGTTSASYMTTTTTTTTNTSTKRASATSLRKTSPTKAGTGTTSAGAGKLSPTKTTTTTTTSTSMRSRTKEAGKPITGLKTTKSPIGKHNSSDKLKQKQIVEPKANGVPSVDPQLNGDAQHELVSSLQQQNGDGEHFAGENGLLPMEQQQQQPQQSQQPDVEAALIDV